MNIKIFKRLNVARLKNNLHFEFFGNILRILQAFGCDIAHIATLIVQLCEWIDKERLGLDWMRKSETTEQIKAHDHQRDNIFYALRESVRTALRHYDHEIRETARRLDVVLETFKSIPKLELPAESAAIEGLLIAMEKRMDDVETLNLTGWLEELNKHNEAVRTLMAERNSETAGKPELTMKQVRRQVNTTYNDIITTIESAIVIEGREKYARLIQEMNACIDEYIRISARTNDDNPGNNPSNE